MTKLKKLLLYIVSLSLAGVIIIFGLSEFIKLNTSSEIYKELEDLPVSHTVIILGASVYRDGKLSPILKDRVETALTVYRMQKAEHFLLSGDNREEDYDEVNAMRNYLLQKGVPEEKITTDPAGIDTYDSMYRSGSIYDIPSAVVVTQPFHLPRTIFIAKNLGYDYKGFPATSDTHITKNKLPLREKLANFKAVFELLTKHKPALPDKNLTVKD